MGRRTRDLRLGDLGLEAMELEDVGLEEVNSETWDSGSRGRAGTRGRDKQTTPDICAEFVECNFR